MTPKKDKQLFRGQRPKKSAPLDPPKKNCLNSDFFLLHLEEFNFFQKRHACLLCVKCFFQNKCPFPIKLPFSPDYNNIHAFSPKVASLFSSKITFSPSNIAFSPSNSAFSPTKIAFSPSKIAYSHVFLQKKLPFNPTIAFSLLK
jgi:hypothetical protein